MLYDETFDDVFLVSTQFTNALHRARSPRFTIGSRGKKKERNNAAVVVVVVAAADQNRVTNCVISATYTQRAVPAAAAAAAAISFIQLRRLSTVHRLNATDTAPTIHC